MKSQKRVRSKSKRKSVCVCERERERARKAFGFQILKANVFEPNLAIHVQLNVNYALEGSFCLKIRQF